MSLEVSKSVFHSFSQLIHRQIFEITYFNVINCMSLMQKMKGSCNKQSKPFRAEGFFAQSIPFDFCLDSEFAHRFCEHQLHRVGILCKTFPPKKTAAWPRGIQLQSRELKLRKKKSNLFTLSPNLDLQSTKADLRS